MELDLPPRPTSGEGSKRPDPFIQRPLSTFDMNLLRGLMTGYPINQETRIDRTKALRVGCYSKREDLKKGFQVFLNYGVYFRAISGGMTVDLPLSYGSFLRGSIYSIYPTGVSLDRNLSPEKFAEEDLNMLDALLIGMIIYQQNRKAYNLPFANNAAATSVRRRLKQHLTAAHLDNNQENGGTTIVVLNKEGLEDHLRRSKVLPLLPAAHPFIAPITPLVSIEPATLTSEPPPTNGHDHVLSPGRKLSSGEITLMETGAFNPARRDVETVIAEKKLATILTLSPQTATEKQAKFERWLRGS